MPHDCHSGHDAFILGRVASIVGCGPDAIWMLLTLNTCRGERRAWVWSPVAGQMTIWMPLPTSPLLLPHSGDSPLPPRPPHIHLTYVSAGLKTEDRGMVLRLALNGCA